MPMTPYSGDVEIITNIGTTPQERGLSTDEFKAKFDEGLKNFVTWFNDMHKTEFDAHLADIVTDADGAHGLQVEYGVFTPVLSFGGASVGITYSRQKGRYKKIGTLVHFEIDLILTSKGTSAGNASISGLPFVSDAVSPLRSFVFSLLANFIYPATAKNIIGNYINSSNQLLIQYVADNSGNASITNTNFNNTTTLQISGSYHI